MVNSIMYSLNEIYDLFQPNHKYIIPSESVIRLKQLEKEILALIPQLNQTNPSSNHASSNYSSNPQTYSTFASKNRSFTKTSSSNSNHKDSFSSKPNT